MHSMFYVLTTIKKDLEIISTDEVYDEMANIAHYVTKSQDIKVEVSYLEAEDIKIQEDTGITEDGEKIKIYKIVDAAKFVESELKNRKSEIEKKYKIFMQDPTEVNAYFLSTAAYPRDEYHYYIASQEHRRFFANSFEFALYLKNHPELDLYIYQAFQYHS